MHCDTLTGLHCSGRSVTGPDGSTVPADPVIAPLEADSNIDTSSQAAFWEVGGHYGDIAQLGRARVKRLAKR